MYTSYAQNFEDVMLWRALKHVSNGYYIDIGAQDPSIDSVSLRLLRTWLAWCPRRAHARLCGEVA